MSISKAQASALADKFLDNIGTSEKLQPKNTYTEMIVLAGEFIEDAQNNLIKNKSISTGELSSSLVANEPERDGEGIKMDVFMNFYGRFVNKGVKGTREGSSRAGYSFKNENPGKSMVKAIRKWMLKARVGTRTVKKYAGHGLHETKQKSVAQIDGAYAVARSIKIKGIKATGFLDDAVDTTSKKVGDRLGAAFRIDVINSIMGK